MTDPSKPIPASTDTAARPASALDPLGREGARAADRPWALRWRQSVPTASCDVADEAQDDAPPTPPHLLYPAFAGPGRAPPPAARRALAARRTSKPSSIEGGRGVTYEPFRHRRQTRIELSPKSGLAG